MYVQAHVSKTQTQQIMSSMHRSPAPGEMHIHKKFYLNWTQLLPWSQSHCNQLFLCRDSLNCWSYLMIIRTSLNGRQFQLIKAAVDCFSMCFSAANRRQSQQVYADWFWAKEVCLPLSRSSRKLNRRTGRGKVARLRQVVTCRGIVSLG